MTSVSISKVPNCLIADMCEDYKRASNMSFLVIYSNGYQFLCERDVDGVNIENPKDMPWNMRSDGFDIWPHTLSDDLWFIGVYWPQKYEIIFIVNNGDPNTSAIVYNSITDKNWWKHMRKTALNSTVFFNGLFSLNDSIYAVGNGKDIFRLYLEDERQRSFRRIVKIINFMTD